MTRTVTATGSRPLGVDREARGCDFMHARARSELLEPGLVGLNASLAPTV